MKQISVILASFLVFWSSLLAGTEFGRGLSQAIARISKNNGKGVIIYLQNDKKSDKLIHAGYEDVYFALDSPWPPPDSTQTK